MEKIILGISLGFNSSAALVSSERGILAAISEERMNNEKNTKKFPTNAIKKILTISDVKPEAIKEVAYTHYESFDVYNLASKHITDEDAHTDSVKKLLEAAISNKEIINIHRKGIVSDRLYQTFEVDEFYTIFRNELAKLNIIPTVINRIEHHDSHMLPAYFFSGFDKKSTTLVVTSDGFGDGTSGTISIVGYDEENNDKPFFLPLSANGLDGSVGLVYQFITGALGFKEHQHEGKVTGLAAYGNPERFAQYFDSLMSLDKGNIVWVKSKLKENEVYRNHPIIDFEWFWTIKDEIYEWVSSFKNEDGNFYPEDFQDIAAGVQSWAERMITKWIKSAIDKVDPFGSFNICLNGGVFANVKINQRVQEMKNIENVFVLPSMGDEGGAVGAAVSMLKDKDLIRSKKLKDVFLGTEYDDIEIEKVLNKYYLDDKVEYKKYLKNEIPLMIAQKLSDKKIVCRFTGRMEWGPRALCHRSIMYHCREKEVNKWLNEQLSRTEFMPFAPFTKIENANDLFYNVKGKEHAAEFMTITMDCKDEFIQNYPAACHIDNTARPQLIVKENNEEAWMILDYLERINGDKVLINTSFNLHNYPIIESPEVAIESWLTSNTDYLAIGNFFVVKKGGKI